MVLINYLKGQLQIAFLCGDKAQESHTKALKEAEEYRFTFDDVKLIKNEVKEIDVLSPRIQLGNFRGTVTVTRNGQSSGSSVYGDFPSIDKISKKNLVEGRFMNQDDIDKKKKICVIGSDTYKLLFKTDEDLLEVT